MFYKYPEKWTEDKFDVLSGEDDRFEWKLGRTFSQSDENNFRKKLGQELGAFANSFGGTLFVGVSDDKKIVGVPKIWRGRQSTKEWLENVIPTLFELRLQHFRVTEMELCDETQNDIGSDKAVVVIDVLDSEIAPHQCVTDKRYYYRVSSKSEPAPHHYLAFLWSRTNSNMSQVANWWFVKFLDPVIDLLKSVKIKFEYNTFPLSMIQLGLYSTHSYFLIDFTNLGKWSELLTGEAGEYFLNTFPLIENELNKFINKAVKLNNSFFTLQKKLSESEIYKSSLLDYYRDLVKLENISLSQFENKNLVELSILIVRELGSELSHYPDESKNTLLRNTSYYLTEITPIPPAIIVANERKILEVGQRLANSIIEKENPFLEDVQTIKQLFEQIKDESSKLWLYLKTERIALAKRYTAIFG
jgi:hypothetical protein